MKGFLSRVKGFAQTYRKELRLFWRYAIPAKLHVWRYHSQKVILFRLDLIGDCTMFTSTAKAIREFYQNREMTLICLSISKPVFERLGIFDKIITIDFRPHVIDFEKLEYLISELRKEKYDLLLQPQISKYPLADILGAAVKCNKRIAIETKPGNSSASWVRMVNFLYQKRIPYPRGIVSEFDYYGAFVRGLGYTGYQTTCPCLTYYEQHFIECDYYVLYPGGSLSQKFWPAHRFAQIANYIYEKTGLLAVILGVADEQWVSDQLKENLTPQAAMATVDLTGRTSMSDVIDLIGNAKLVVSNDTSGVHIACATRTPSVVNVGGWHFKRFLPYHIENVKPGDCLPSVAYTQMPCYYCDWQWSIVGERNEECLRRLKCGEPSECIEKVTYEQMRELVDQIIEDEELC
ncbi:MAG: glycosyltransferase family 9 protein [Oscillospiraceae bacterium]|nr:glycosyltransferase family 9 protein [Oscillospiraceae bacterium]